MGKDQAERYLNRNGKSGTLKTWGSKGARDANQGEPTYPNQATTSILYLKELRTGAADIVRGPMGQKRHIEARVRVLDGAVSGMPGLDDPDTKAPVFTDEDGEEYEVVLVGPEKAGWRQLYCERRRG